MKYVALLLLSLLAACTLETPQAETSIGLPAKSDPFTPSVPPAPAPSLPPGLYTQVTTPRGTIIGELYYKKCPMTVANYVGLAEGTLGPNKGPPPTPFYNNNPFHRVVKNFVIQGGPGAAETPDPDGGPGYSFPDEIVPGLRHDSVGVIQMANDGPDTNGSQWCMMAAPVNRLNYNHTVFGHVVQGIDILPKIEQGDRMQVQILRIGPEAEAFKADQATFDALVAKAKRYDGPREPGPAAWFHDANGILPTDPPRAQAFNYKLGNVQRFIGQRIIARLYAKTPPEAAGRHLNAFLNMLAQSNGVAREGALAVYFKDTDQWHIRIAGDARIEFAAGPRNANGVKPTATRTYDQALASFLDTVRTEQPRLIAVARAAATMPAATQPFTSGQYVKFQVDSVLDNLIFHLEPPHGPVK